jgi:DNA-binding XRE family transcriptional regulator
VKGIGTRSVDVKVERDKGPTTRKCNRSVLVPGLRAARRESGLTQRELGRLAGVGKGTITELESLRRGAYPVTMRKLCTALGLAPAQLTRDRLLE